jgi:hypothetical protein
VKPSKPSDRDGKPQTKPDDIWEKIREKIWKGGRVTPPGKSRGSSSIVDTHKPPRPPKPRSVPPAYETRRVPMCTRLRSTIRSTTLSRSRPIRQDLATQPKSTKSLSRLSLGLLGLALGSTHNPLVVGSNPTGPTIRNNKLRCY